MRALFSWKLRRLALSRMALCMSMQLAAGFLWTSSRRPLRPLWTWPRSLPLLRCCPFRSRSRPSRFPRSYRLLNAAQATQWLPVARSLAQWRRAWTRTTCSEAWISSTIPYRCLCGTVAAQLHPRRRCSSRPELLSSSSMPPVLDF